tara:strand:+ start:762 stop:974 length:213 start_codon:yes stop_codon:yes gene_type:complete
MTMDKFIELELTLMNGDDYYICDRSFSVMMEKRKQPWNPDTYKACAVNGFAVMETYSEVIAMIRKAKGAK